MCYTGNLLDPAEDIYTLDYYLGLAQEIVHAGAHILAIKDMAGLLRPQAAKVLVMRFRAVSSPTCGPRLRLWAWQTGLKTLNLRTQTRTGSWGA